MPIIEVKNLTKKFGAGENTVIAVNSVSFSVPEGKIFAFLGPNGAGKTTTIKMLTTLLEPTGGDALINGFDLKNERDNIRHSFGIVFQDPSLDDDLSAYENMEFHAVLYGVGKAERVKRIEELLKLVDLWDRKGDFVKNYSGGMKRRLEIARSLIHTPKIIFLDEPTVGLDPQTRNHIWSYVVNLSKKEGVTVFLTTHYMEEADKMADNVVIIDHGKIIGSGTPEELKSKTGTTSLEEAFLKLTGNTIRPDEATSMDALRSQARMWGRRK
jgi:ABC-2 type transport system ATP-binding protein